MLQSSPPCLLGRQEVWESQEVVCACLGAAMCSAASAAGGRNGRALLERFPRQMLLCFSNNPRGCDSESCLVKAWRSRASLSHCCVWGSSAEVGKAAGQCMPRNSAGLLPPEPKPATTCLQHYWCLSMMCCSWMRQDVKEVK